MKHLFIIYTVILLCFQSQAAASSFSAKGQFWISGLYGTDASIDQSSFESSIGYIPTVSFFRGLSHEGLLDVEWAYRVEQYYSGDSLLFENYDPHRVWVRYSSQTIEARFGLQKITFGPAQMLRTLSWFDTIDLKDPTGQTDGVDAFRLRWFPSNSMALWSWAVRDKDEFLSWGGRAEFSTELGEWGLTIHHDPSDSLQLIGQTRAWIDQPHNRIALDFRYDGFMGLWNESAFILSDETEIQMVTVGADYTLPIAGGMLLMAESMYISNSQTDTDQLYTAFMSSIPIGMINQLMFITQVDWEEEHAYHYIRWSATYDRFSLNFIVSNSPKRSAYNIPVQELPKTAAGFGTNLQFMFIYNH